MVEKDSRESGGKEYSRTEIIIYFLCSLEIKSFLGCHNSSLERNVLKTVVVKRLFFITSAPISNRGMYSDSKFLKRIVPDGRWAHHFA